MDQKQICLNTNIHIKDGHKNVKIWNLLCQWNKNNYLVLWFTVKKTDGQSCQNISKTVEILSKHFF